MGNPYKAESGGGRLYLAPWNGSTPPQDSDYRYVGNCLNFSEEPKVIKKIHKNHDGGTEVTDRKIKVREELSLKFTLDELDIDNLAMFFHGVKDGTAIYPMEAETQEFAVKYEQELISGDERVYEWWKVEITGASGLEKVNHGDGEDDWAKMEFEGEGLADAANHPNNKWGRIYIKPTP